MKKKELKTKEKVVRTEKTLIKELKNYVQKQVHKISIHDTILKLAKRYNSKKIKKITLMEAAQTEHNVFEYSKIPRLGLAIIGEILRKRGYDVEIYNLNISKLDIGRFISSDLIGISSITPTIYEAYKLASKATWLKIPVVMGGPHSTFLPEESLNYADFVVRGEGEETIVELIDALNQSKPLDTIKGLSYKREGKIIHNPARKLIDDLNTLPAPNLALIKNSPKISPIPILNSRGCPYNCYFCSVVPMFGRKYRFKKAEKVISEIKSVKAKSVFFYDDNFLANREHTIKLLTKMIKNKLTPPWSAQVRISIGKDEEVVKLMKKANCYLIYAGLESINPQTLDTYDKHQTVDDIVKGIGMFHKYGIKTHGMFIFGSDDDTSTTIHDTVNFAIKNKIDTVQFSILTPFPGTRLYNDFESKNRIFSKEWRLYDGQHTVFYPKNISPYELQFETFKAYKKFYSYSNSWSSFLKFNFYRSAINLYAKKVIRKWEKTNKEFIEELKILTKLKPAFVS